MPQIESWSRIPAAVRHHLIDRMHDRNISLTDLNGHWMETQPEVPEGSWYKDFGSFKLCVEGKYPKHFFLLARLLSDRSCDFAGGAAALLFALGGRANETVDHRAQYHRDHAADGGEAIPS